MSTKLGIEHVRRVRVLYKSILRLHRGLPVELGSLGDAYVRDEFKRHKDADVNFVPVFMTEWTNYAMTLAQQLKRQRRHPAEPLFGRTLTEVEYSAMSDQQVAQLFELFKEMQKPRDPNDPLGVSEHPLATDLKDS